MKFCQGKSPCLPREVLPYRVLTFWYVLEVSMKKQLWWLICLFWVVGFGRVTAVSACGGLFCQNNPVDQNAERIIFVQNGDGTVSAIIQIQYTGFDDDFSWILPLPEAIPADAIEVPETAAAAFTELELATNPVYIAPPLPECAQVDFAEQPVLSAASDEVQVFASGSVGPYGFDIIGSSDPDALITWLREHNYRVTAGMEPLINLYVAEQFVFLAMRLLPEQGVQDIQPIQVTYPSERPMIPLRLTAVAANPNMAVLTWFFATSQAVPSNYTHMQIPDDDIRFTFFSNNYRQLIGETADQYNGQAFVTEYAGPSNQITFSDPLLQELAQKHPYLTRLNTVISPEEMTLDPIFHYDPTLPDISNIHDLSTRSGLYECEQTGFNLPAIFQSEDDQSQDSGFSRGVIAGGAVVLLAFLLVGVGVWIGRRGGG